MIRPATLWRHSRRRSPPWLPTCRAWTAKPRMRASRRSSDRWATSRERDDIRGLLVGCAAGNRQPFARPRTGRGIRFAEAQANVGDRDRHGAAAPTDELLPQLQDYDEAIRGTIGLRQQPRLPREQALYMASCSSDSSRHLAQLLKDRPGATVKPGAARLPGETRSSFGVRNRVQSQTGSEKSIRRHHRDARCGFRLKTRFARSGAGSDRRSAQLKGTRSRFNAVNFALFETNLYRLKSTTCALCFIQE